jgi:hypothetical protein
MGHPRWPNRVVCGAARIDMTTGERSPEGSGVPGPGRPMDDNADFDSSDQPSGAELTPAPERRASPR